MKDLHCPFAGTVRFISLLPLIWILLELQHQARVVLLCPDGDVIIKSNHQQNNNHGGRRHHQ
jgi:hypothetical protein